MMHDIRNIAIIAHVDHGKTTLVDKILFFCKLFKEHENPGELILDSNDLERERGITILAKNVAVMYKNTKINIIDTPGHADFGGEVERVLNMADGALLLVDAFEGPMPQTRYVLRKAISLGLKIILVINKIDKPNCRPDLVHEQVFDLMFNLNANEQQLDFPTLYGSAKQGWMTTDPAVRTQDISPLLDCILQHIPPPRIRTGTTQMQITSIEYSNYVGRIAIGRVYRGNLCEGQQVAVVRRDNSILRTKIKDLMVFEGLSKRKTEVVYCGDICAIVGLEAFDIGDTLADYENPEPLPTLAIEEPTMSMLFTINNSPFMGRDGRFITSRHLRERLERELEKNLALRVEPADRAESFIVYGRGILHLAILIETMRREGYELQIGQPRVLFKQIDGEKHEPIEDLTIDLPDEYSGVAIDLVTQRRGEMLVMERRNDRVHLEFTIPSRGLIGLRNRMLTATNGEVVMTHRLKGYGPYRGDIAGRINGSLVAMETGTAIAYSIDKLQDRGTFFVNPGEEIYEGQIVGEHIKAGDLVVNLCITKKLTNIRAAGSDEKMHIAPAVKFSLEEALEYIQEDDYVEVTPLAIRLRKILLNENDRKRARKK